MPYDYRSRSRSPVRCPAECVSPRRRSRSPRGHAPSVEEFNSPITLDEIPNFRVKDELMPLARYLGIPSTVRFKDELVYEISQRLPSAGTVYLSDVLAAYGPQEYSYLEGKPSQLRSRSPVYRRYGGAKKVGHTKVYEVDVKKVGQGYDVDDDLSNLYLGKGKYVGDKKEALIETPSQRRIYGGAKKVGHAYDVSWKRVGQGYDDVESYTAGDAYKYVGKGRRYSYDGGSL